MLCLHTRSTILARIAAVAEGCLMVSLERLWLGFHRIVKYLDSHTPQVTAERRSERAQR